MKIRKALKIFGISFSILIVVILLAMMTFSLVQPLIYGEYYGEAKKEFTAAGLNDGLVPQGFCYSEENSVFLECGYMTNGKDASRIYIVSEDGKKSRFVELKTESGDNYTGHTGGIAIGEDLVWLANDGEGDDNCVWVLSLGEILDERTQSITLSTRFFPESRAACCFVNDGYLWVGEFYDPEKYPTKETHHLPTPSGETNPSLICAYLIDETANTGIATDTPEKAISVREKLQGFAFVNGKIVLSTSYGLANSHLYVYRDVTKEEPAGEIDIDGTRVPVWYLDNDSLERDIVAPPMSEELSVKEDRVYILYESACHKYVFGILTRGKWVYSIEIDSSEG